MRVALPGLTVVILTSSREVSHYYETSVSRLSPYFLKFWNLAVLDERVALGMHRNFMFARLSGRRGCSSIFFQTAEFCVL